MRERADQDVELAGLDDEEDAPHDLDRGDGEEATRARVGSPRWSIIAITCNRPAANEPDRDAVADLPDEHGLVGLGSSLRLVRGLVDAPTRRSR